MTKYSMHILGVSPFSKLQNNSEEWDVGFL